MQESHISEEQITGWLDPDILTEVGEEEPQGDEQFRLTVETHGWEMVIRKTREDGPIVILSALSPSPEIRGNLIELDAERRNLQMRLDLLLTDSPGYFHYENEEGEPTDNLAEMESVVLAKRIYPDGASQDKLMNAILDMATRLSYIRNITNLLLEDIEDRR